MARLTFIGYRPRVLPRFWQYGLSGHGDSGNEFAGIYCLH